MKNANKASSQNHGQRQDTKILVFLKAPLLGLPKSRLAKDIGDSQTLSAYRTLVSDFLLSLQQRTTVELVFTPVNSRAEIAPWIHHPWEANPQAEGDLGQRLSAAFETAFTKGFKKVLALGVDCPYVTPSDLSEAETALDSHPVVIGPANDGGYWLIGLQKPQPQLFEDIPWSTASVFPVTQKKATLCNLSYHILRTLEDVDDLESWNRYLDWKSHNQSPLTDRSF